MTTREVTTAVNGFGELLRVHRVERSLTQDELAERSGLTVKAVGALERGERRRPYPHTVRALADALGLDEGERRAFVDAVPSRAGRGLQDTVRDDDAPACSGRAGRGCGPAPWVPVPSPLFGRDDQLAVVAGMLRSPVRRVVTLTGPGGVGKTALAQLAAAAVCDAFAGGAVVELADVTDPAAVVPAVAAAFGVRGGDPAAGLVAALAGRRVLLVLDNLEHVLGCVAEVLALVDACPELVVLATSRVSLRVRHEQQVRLALLPHEAAVRLFHDRMAAAGAEVGTGPEDEIRAVAELCRRADGLPLALELAAVAAARFGPAALLGRLDTIPGAALRDVPVRQRSMAATFAWSHELLGQPARRLLARLAVFAGGATLDEVRSGAADGGEVVQALTALSELIDHGLVLRTIAPAGTARFRVLGPVREVIALTPPAGVPL